MSGVTISAGPAAAHASRSPLLVVGLAVLWGANWPAMKAGIEAGLTPLWMAAARFLAGALCLGAVVVLRGLPLRLARQDWPVMLVGAAGPMAAFTALSCLALTVLPAGPSIVVAYATPLWVVPTAWLLLGERPGRLALAGAVVGLTGVAVMSGPWTLDWRDPAVLLGQAALLLAAGCWAVSILRVRSNPGVIATPMPVLVLWQLMVAAVAMTVIAASVEPPPALSVLASPSVGLALLYIGPFGTALGFLMMLEINRRMTATAMATATLGVPVAGLVLAWLLLGEHPGLASMIGAGLVVLGVSLAAFKPFSPTQGTRP